MKHTIFILLLASCIFSCGQQQNDGTKTAQPETPFVWEGANFYFLLTDRFNNGDTSNDINFNRIKKPGKLRGFQGGDLKGVTQKIEEGYFTDLGVNAIWMTPIVEQIHDGTDEGTGLSYAFHGYWAKDWTTLDPNFGTKADLKNLVEAAHKKNIRVLLDAVVNHTGPVTDEDPVWPESWVRTEPQCSYDTYENTVSCTLVENLPDIKTESDAAVELPPALVSKWKAEGRYDDEVAELDVFFEKTGYPRAPRFYIMKWLSDYITDYGIDGYRVDTVKHTEEYVWQEFKTICDDAFSNFKTQNPDKVLDDNDFYLVGEVYNYGISAGKAFDFGDKKVNYFDKAFNSLINFELKWNVAQQTKEEVFSRYSDTLSTNMKGYGVLNYLSSHDDGQPFDPTRQKPYETANMLLLSPGASQIYYGDESARSLVIDGTKGDATLRSNMNWDAIKNNDSTQRILAHWQKLGQFRNNHPAVGAGTHHMITETPYVFSRSYTHGNFKDLVVVAMDLKEYIKTLSVKNVFEDGTVLHDAYSNQDVTVKNGNIELESEFDIVLLEKK
ncbi:alpha-amylase family glycosyl hydrolase [Psychroserpens damuponensis]|uniref:alpha-amylase family glycosyl hydrolase n=1 Tax=Psychroserpens damuponensis TaxID=943936 RepID=UPI00058C82D5|nr:alpha-amylase family glycosyl hydrolase [Psychroserpens damuponensis]